MNGVRLSKAGWALVVSLALPCMGLGADWPQWQGPNRDNKSSEEGLLSQWPNGGPSLTWKTEGLGGGYSTPSIAKGEVYGMGYRGAYEVVWALDEATGEEMWSRRTGVADRNVGYSEGPRCTPTVDGDRLYTLSVNGKLHCLDRQSGDIVWERHLKKDFGGKMMSGWGYSESPLVDGNKLICTPGGSEGTLLALEKKTGEKIWQSNEWQDDAAYSSAIVRDWGGVRQYIQLTDASVGGVAASDGRLLWGADRSGRTAVIPTPIASKQSVYVTSGYGVGCNRFAIEVGDSDFASKEVYANKVMVNHHGGVVLVEGSLFGYSDGKGWVCQDFESGELIWQEKEMLGKGSLTYADGHLYLRGQSGAGTVVLIEATSEGYREKGRFDQPYRSNKNSWPHPVIANGKLFLRDQGVLLAYDVSNEP